MPRRRPAVAGAFYERSSEALIAQIQSCFTSPLGPSQLPEVPLELGERRLPALICPHAGYMYSGPVAAHSYISLRGRRRPMTAVVIGPNHYGVGAAVSIYPEGEWATPLGSVRIDHELSLELSRESDIFSLDEASHVNEHSIEVQVPFLQYLIGAFKLVPICILDQSEETCVEVGEALARVLGGRDILLVASSDFTHYEPHEKAKAKDAKALEQIAKLDVHGLYSAIYDYDVTMCGYGAVTAVLTAAKQLGAAEAKILKHATSGDSSGDYGSVVGYAACLVELPQ